MTRNQKIALGCGGAGCLGLIVVVIAGGLIYFLYRAPARARREYNFNVSTNRNSNSNLNDNTNADSNDNSNSSSTSTTSASSLSEDDKHKLYQAAFITGDEELVRRVSVKIGLMNEDFTPGQHYQEFLGAHVSWLLRNGDFIQSINTREKARAYVDANLPE
jgi:hypothetical protein